jgi:hypothetical protein
MPDFWECQLDANATGKSEAPRNTGIFQTGCGALDLQSFGGNKQKGMREHETLKYQILLDWRGL